MTDTEKAIEAFLASVPEEGQVFLRHPVVAQLVRSAFIAGEAKGVCDGNAILDEINAKMDRFLHEKV